MKVPYQDLYDQQFEQLVVELCKELLGVATQGFSPGKDGGRDAKFVGTAQLMPSTAAPWKGIVVVQAKHTRTTNASFSDSDFFSETSDQSVLGKELSRIIKLKDAGELDHYMLFANRHLTAIQESKLSKHIVRRVGIPRESIYLCGIENLDSFLRQFPDVLRRVRHNPIDSPLTVDPQELAEVVEALAEYFKTAPSPAATAPTARVPYAEKNRVNNMTEEYARQQTRNYLKDTSEISRFLAAPENEHLRQRYETAAQEFQLQIIAKRNDYQKFDEVMEFLAALLFARDSVLARNKRFTRAMLYYMYWNCDIGGSDDA